LGARLETGSAAAAGVPRGGLLVLLRRLLVLLGGLLVRLLVRLVAVVTRSHLRALLILHEEVDERGRPAYDDQDDYDHPASSEFL